MTCNLVELRGHALKNYGVTDVGKQGIATAMTKSDRHNSVFDREVNQFGTAAKSVHLHHLVLMEFDSSRRNRKFARNLLRRASFRQQLKNPFLPGRERIRAFLPASSATLGLLDHLFGQGGGNESLPFQSGMDGHNQFLRGRMLDHKAGSAGVERAARIRRVLMHRQENDLDVGVGFPELS